MHDQVIRCHHKLPIYECEKCYPIFLKETTVGDALDDLLPENLPAFVFELMPSIEAVRGKIQECEGHHIQQAIYSTYMDTLTQICFAEQKIRCNRWWTVPNQRKQEEVN